MKKTVKTISRYTKELLELNNLIVKRAFIHLKEEDSITLSSGEKTNIYFDLRRITLSQDGARLISKIILSFISDIDIDIVCGMTLGADPLVSSILSLSDKKIDGALIRKNRKNHGMRNLIEGCSVQGKKVMLVDDVSTSGSSIKRSIDIIRSEGGEVSLVVAVVNRGERTFFISNAPFLFLLHKDNFL